eukprot:359447-Chlamydomonas_euryale.AAC.7
MQQPPPTAETRPQRGTAVVAAQKRRKSGVVDSDASPQQQKYCTWVARHASLARCIPAVSVSSVTPASAGVGRGDRCASGASKRQGNSQGSFYRAGAARLAAVHQRPVGRRMGVNLSSEEDVHAWRSKLSARRGICSPRSATRHKPRPSVVTAHGDRPLHPPMLHTTVRHRAARPHAAPAPLRSAGGPLSFRTLRASHGLARTPTAATCRRAAAAGAAARPSRSPSVRAFAILDAVKSFLGMGAKQSKGWAPSPSADVERRIAAGSCMDVTPLTEAQREEAAAALPQASKFIVLQHGTERPFSGSVGCADAVEGGGMKRGRHM